MRKKKSNLKNVLVLHAALITSGKRHTVAAVFFFFFQSKLLKQVQFVQRFTLNMDPIFYLKEASKPTISCFLGLHLRHMEVHRLEIKSEL